MVRGYDANRERMAEVASFGKPLGKRAGFKCEWCEGSGDLRPWDYRPEREPSMETLALLCGRCRELAAGGKGESGELRSLQNALWSDLPPVAEGVARVLARSGEAWVREAIAESLIDEKLKEELLKKCGSL